MMYEEFFEGIETIKDFNCKEETKTKMVNLLKKLIKKHRLNRVYINNDGTYVSMEFTLSKTAKIEINCSNYGTITKELTEWEEEIFTTMEDINEL